MVESRRIFMIGQGIFNMITLMFMSIMEGINYDPGYVLSALLNAIGTVSYTHLTLPTICSV